MIRHDSMKGWFAYELHERMATNLNIWVVTGDLGYKMWDGIRDDYPDRFINAGAAEQAMLGIGVGLALQGKIPFVYTISSFFLRAAETISLYLHEEQVPVKLIGGGRDGDYTHFGKSHDGAMAQKYLKSLTIQQFYPQIKEGVPDMVGKMLENNKPSFISLRR